MHYVIKNFDDHLILDNGHILWYRQWNGEIFANEKHGQFYRPVYDMVGEDDFVLKYYEKVRG